MARKIARSILIQTGKPKSVVEFYQTKREYVLVGFLTEKLYNYCFSVN